ncbi:MAG: hypothetical protein WCI74_12410, partial [Actinomycetes bacterium]
MRFERIIAIAMAVGATVAVAGCSQHAEPVILGQQDNLWQLANDPKPALPWVVGLGDSYSSGEAGRWASNGSNNAQYASNGGWLVGTVDQVYGDSPQGTESIPYCNRSATAPAFVGVGWNTKEFACSGAKTSTFISSQGRVKPGIDFVNEATPFGQVTGQALMLQQFAATHDVKVVTMSIGGNDMGFSDVISNCLQAFLTPLSSKTCSQTTAVGAMVNNAAKAVLTDSVANAVLNVNKAMKAAGKSAKDWRLLLFTYPSPVPLPGQMMYGEGYERQTKGGCGMLDADLLWSNLVLIPYMDQIISGAAATAKKTNPELAPVTVLNTN